MSKKIAFLVLIVTLCFHYGHSQTKSYKLIVFEGSDWCSNCIRFTNTILSDEHFLEYLKAQNIYTEHIDFPQRLIQDENTKQYNAGIAEKYNFNGLFPTILLVKPNTDFVVEILYANQSTNEFIAIIDSKLNLDH